MRAVGCAAPVSLGPSSSAWGSVLRAGGAAYANMQEGANIHGGMWPDVALPARL
jgi:hypothetical protein